MTDTPRTDSLRAKKFKKGVSYNEMCDLARTLERELNVERERFAQGGPVAAICALDGCCVLRREK
jgi:hypothetical protein